MVQDRWVLSRWTQRWRRWVVVTVGAVLLGAPPLIGAAGTAQAASPTVALGSAASFSVLAGDSITSGGDTEVTGDLGTYPSSPVGGFPPGTIDGTEDIGDSAAQQATADFTTAYRDAAGRPATGSVAGDPNGLTYGPGVYGAAAALTMTGTTTLDANGNTDAVFIFQVHGAVTAAALSKMALANGAQAKNVFWQLQGALTVGASATFVGTVLASGAITLGDHSTLIGRALSGGKITLASNSITFSDEIGPKIDINGGSTAVSTTHQTVIAGTSDAPPGTALRVKISGGTLATTVLSDGTWTVTTNLADGTFSVSASVTAASGSVGTAHQSLTVRTPTLLVQLASAVTYSVLGSGGATSIEDSVVAGDLGTGIAGSVVGFPPGIVNGSTHDGDTSAGQALIDAKAAYLDARKRIPSGTFAGDQIGHTFFPGVYYSGAAFALSGTMTLDGGGNPNAVFIFQLNAAMSPAAGANIDLINGAVASRVFWQVNGAVTTGAGSITEGTFLANGAISVGAKNVILGRLLALNGAVTLDDNRVKAPPPGFLSISAPTNAVDLGSQRNAVNGETFSGMLGVVTVSDQRGYGDGNWAASVSSTDFAAPSVDPIAASGIGYDPGTVSTTGTATTAGTISTDLSSPVPAVTASQSNDINTAWWNPTITVSVPEGAVSATYSATITHSVL